MCYENQNPCAKSFPLSGGVRNNSEHKLVMHPFNHHKMTSRSEKFCFIYQSNLIMKLAPPSALAGRLAPWDTLELVGVGPVSHQLSSNLEV